MSLLTHQALGNTLFNTIKVTYRAAVTRKFGNHPLRCLQMTSHQVQSTPSFINTGNSITSGNTNDLIKNEDSQPLINSETSLECDADMGSEEGSEAPFPTHYIDTLEVYKELVSAGFTDLQSRRIIQITEQNLVSNLDCMIQKCAPKKDLENENYLFEAASSELSVEIKRSREQHLNKLRGGINILDRELNSVTDELNDLMISCKNECEVAINDHKSDNGLAQKQLNIKIREVENKINSRLISELKFSVENLRWSLTRRGIFCILSVAASVLLAVTGSKFLNQVEQEEVIEVTNTSSRDDFVKDNDEFPKENYECST
ncbi:Put7 protein [Saccharomycopsis crataegensis]|uniref:Put7 protein n=1 Tax=Saccharomycopsis crataegensis TaxID=43959 RepID=A0AAV5QJ48_9ASCO|nr:Put7 protein [Saccharomycopsis crataegensis]